MADNMSEDLTDEQIEQLLARATERLKQKEQKARPATKQNFTFPKLNPGRLVPDETPRKNLDIGIRKVQDPIVAKKAALEAKIATAGPSWFNMPRTDLTPELKRDLQLLKMRNVLDPHRHYKKDGGKMQAPEYSQMGTIIEGPTEFFSGRIENKQRKKTFVEEVLAGEQQTGRFKKKYGELQGRKTSGKKAYYNAMKDKRKIGGVKKGSG
ncbi:dTDP-fucopyranose mutase [Elasticomyces elasticus]|nr:dTDP-fucopyranose mutase [Elasticomyces elasticus]